MKIKYPPAFKAEVRTLFGHVLDTRMAQGLPMGRALNDLNYSSDAEISVKDVLKARTLDELKEKANKIQRMRELEDEYNKNYAQWAE